VSLVVFAADIKIPPAVDPRRLTISRDRFVAEVAASPVRENHLARLWQVGGASALLSMQEHHNLFIGGSRSRRNATFGDVKKPRKTR
jgi:hypothetical protein